MHEMGITQNVVSIVSEKAGDSKVSKVVLEIGKLSAVMPEAIRFCFDVCTKNTVLDGAELEIREIDGLALCQACGQEIKLKILAGRWECGSRDLRCVAGEELNIKEMETL